MKEFKDGKFVDLTDMEIYEMGERSAIVLERERILKIIDRFSYEQKESGYEFKDIVISVSILKKAIKQSNLKEGNK